MALICDTKAKAEKAVDVAAAWPACVWLPKAASLATLPLCLSDNRTRIPLNPDRIDT